MKTFPNIEIGDEISEQLTVRRNVGQELLLITVDKVRICLMEARADLSSQKDWIAPLALVLSLSTTVVTADFRDFVFGKAVWQAGYVIAAALSLGWFVRSAVNARRTRNRASIEGILDRLRADAPRVLGQSDLVINRAVYGADGRSVDVTEVLSGRISQGRLQVVASNALQGDPNPGLVKELIVEYTFGGSRETKTVPESATLSLP
jgi:hypothetical protein